MALYGQLKSIKQTMDTLARSKETISENGKSGFKFTRQEIKAMPEHIRKIFIANNYIVNYRITSNGYFEARIRRKGMYIEASGRDFETMRKRFMDRLAAFYERPPAEPTQEPPEPIRTAKTVLFGDYARDWLKIKEQTTKPATFKEYERSFRVDLEPTFGMRPLADITRNDLQNYLFGIVGENKHRKAEKLALMLNCIFDMAAEDFGLPSPMKKVVLPAYQTKRGQALTKDEELRLVNYCKTHKDVEGTDALLVLLLFGLRKSELKSIDNSFSLLSIHSVPSKAPISTKPTLFPFCIVARLLQSTKAPVPIRCTLLPRLTVLILVLPTKAPVPITPTLLGIAKLVSALPAGYCISSSLSL